MTPQQQPAPIRRRKLAIRLTKLRQAASKTQAEVAEWTGLSQSTISKIENAGQEIEVKHVRLLSQCYGIDAPELDQLLRVAAQSNDRGALVEHSDTVPDFAREYFDLEGVAQDIRVHEPGWIFGLFQRPDYIRAVRLSFKPDATEEELQRSIALRMARQELLYGEAPPNLHVILDESVLRRQIGSRVVMGAQLEHLIEVSHLPSVRLQVIPLVAGAHRAIGNGFTILRFDDDKVVYTENLRSATYLEKPSDVAHFESVFEEVGRVALGVDNTRALLDTLKQEWEQPNRKG